MSTKPTAAGELQYDTLQNRVKKGIDVNLPLHYNHKWKARMPLITKMIQHNMTLDLIAEHYGCSAANISIALAAHNRSILLIRHDFRQAFMNKLKEQVKWA